jgi:hypothetical protein
MVNERASAKTVAASSKLTPSLTRLVLALFASHSNVSAIVWSHRAAKFGHAQANTNMLGHIERVGVVFYEKQPATVKS